MYPGQECGTGRIRTFWLPRFFFCKRAPRFPSFSFHPGLVLFANAATVAAVVAVSFFRPGKRTVWLFFFLSLLSLFLSSSVASWASLTLTRTPLVNPLAAAARVGTGLRGARRARAAPRIDFFPAGVRVGKWLAGGRAGERARSPECCRDASACSLGRSWV